MNYNSAHESASRAVPIDLLAMPARAVTTLVANLLNDGLRIAPKLPKKMSRKAAHLMLQSELCSVDVVYRLLYELFDTF